MVDRVGQQLGHYRLVRLLGQGGFAEVYLGEHIYLDTQAAIKVLHTQLAQDGIEQFRLEAKRIAHLEHPHIVRVLDFGVEGTTPFLVMSYAPGGTLRQRHPKGTRLPLSLIVQYVKQVSDALQYAHEEKFIHRDVKPENMLLGRRNEVLLSDFGIATIVHSTTSLSMQAAVGTVPYMAPEQLQEHPRPASDQYALGVVVYEWLCGDRPFEGSFTEIVVKHLTMPPPPLRGRMLTVSPQVEQVVMTALTKDYKQRFASVQAFATALEQACQVEPSQTLPASRLVQPTDAMPQVRPSPPAMELATSPSESVIPTDLVTPPSQASIPTGLSVPSSQMTVPTELVTPPSQAATLPAEVALLSQPSAVPPTEMPSVGPPHRGISRRTVVVGLAGLAVVGVGGGGLLWLARSQQPTAPPTSVSTSTPTPLSVGTTLYTYRGHSGIVDTVAWSSDGKRIASGSYDRTVQVWDATDGGHVYIYRGHADVVNAVAWSPNGKRIASASSDRTVQVWNAADGSNAYTYEGHTSTVYAVAWSPDGKRIASGSDDQTVQVWDAVTGNRIYTYSGHSASVRAVTWSPDGKRIASSGSFDQTVQVWDATDGGHVYTYRGHAAVVNAVAWSPDGKRIASGSDDRTVQVWDAANGSHVYTYEGHTSTVYAVAWSPDGTHIASGSDDGMVKVWDATTRGYVFTYSGHTGPINAVAWSPDGKRIASGSGDQTVQVWQPG